MQKLISLKLLPSEAASETAVKRYIASAAAVKPDNVSGFTILKRSIDARGRQAWINLSVQAFINEPYQQRELMPFHFKDVSKAANTALID